ncbi:MAG: DMT family transporter [Eubacteriaceae bacterium]|jgi:drug/metabolite transporter (DMT)-like permease|nr:DMT family transporter [Eubacteriaceae bacterium]
MKKEKAEFILTLIVMARSSSYLLMKLGLNGIGPFNLIALRFLIAFAAAGIIFRRRLLHMDNTTIKAGIILGLMMFAILTMQIFGLKTMSSSGAAFIAGTTIAFVPLIHALIRRQPPEPKICLLVLMTMSGIALLSIRPGFVFTGGSALYMGGAFIYAVHIVTCDHFAGRIDALAAGIFELAVAGSAAFVCSFIFEKPQLPQSMSEWAIIMALALICSAFGLAIQPMIQQYTEPERYGLLCGLGPVFSGLLAFFFVGEMFSMREFAGAAVILMSTVLMNKVQHAQFCKA